MNVEATVAKLETLETIIEILTDEYNEILDTVNGELEFLAGAIERGVIIPDEEEIMSDEEKMVNKANSLLSILKSFDQL